MVPKFANDHELAGGKRYGIALLDLDCVEPCFISLQDMLR
jgi:hypothetical protein